MRIMSFNLRCADVAGEPWEERIGIVCQTILQSGAQTIGVQEATPGWMAAIQEKAGHKYAFVGVGRDNGGHGEDAGEYSAIFYLKDELEVIQTDTFWLSETPEKVSYGWDADCRRVCTWALFKVKATGEKFVHFNTHFDHIGVVARRESVKMIIERAKAFEGVPAVFTADMNVLEGSENYNQFVNSDFFGDTKMLAPDTMNYCTFHDADPDSHKDYVIDYVMINKGFTANTYRVLYEGIDGRFVSDHFPIYADVDIK